MKMPEEVKKALRMCVQIGGDCEGGRICLTER